MGMSGSVVVIILACLATKPDACSADRVPLIGEKCDQRQIEFSLLPQWMERHPQHTVKAWKCTPIGKSEIEV
jgi:hypothetical protein